MWLHRQNSQCLPSSSSTLKMACLLAFVGKWLRKCVSDWSFRSLDRRFGLYIPQTEVDKILRRCHKAGMEETGGILFGFYSPGFDCANVTIASAAPPDSKHGKTWFYRGIRGLQAKIDRLWHKREYYLGE